ncbi:MAG TPA: hypothetical protein VFB41_09045 [Solirubrobacteraceae bacterium]|nr:hypothetical protein [Solirubrobacteraceae bacterium]
MSESAATVPIGVHLNGSVNLPDAEAVFETTADLYGTSLKRMPDGETGPRQGWVLAMLPRFRAVEQLVERDGRDRTGAMDVSHDDGTPEIPMPPVFALREGVSPDDIVFEDLGYATAAIESYAVFSELKRRGVIEDEVRFQVSLPTPLAGSGFAAQEDGPAVMAAFEKRLFAEIATIADAIPHDQLAIQWDVAYEIGIIEGILMVGIDDPFDPLVAQLVELASVVPPDVQLGYHLCYGDIPDTPGAVEGKHFVEPRDTSLLVKLANAISSGVDRPIHWFSMPVPIARDDDAYFEPLTELRLPDGCELYLGLVHHQDGAEGARRRIATAQRYVPAFGVASECGLGRKPTELVTRTLEIQRDLVKS